MLIEKIRGNLIFKRYLNSIFFILYCYVSDMNFLAHQVPLALMADQDVRESISLQEDITAMLDSMVHPRYMLRMKPVLRCVSNLLYYCVPLLSLSQSTPGQDFCNLDMVVESVATAASLSAKGGLTAGGASTQVSFTRPSQNRRLLVAALMALIPLVGGLWNDHSQEVQSLALALSSDDSDESVALAVEAATEGRRISAESPVSDHLPSSSSSLSVATDVSDDVKTWLQLVQNVAIRHLHLASGALQATYSEICQQLNANDNHSPHLHGIKHAVSLLLDIHVLLFALFGLYYDPALRLAGVRMMQRKSTSVGSGSGHGGGSGKIISLRVLGWVLGFRLALLGAHGLMLFKKHWTALQSRAVVTVTSGARTLAEAGGEESAKEVTSRRRMGKQQQQQEQQQQERGVLVVAGMEGRSCPLCMDELKHPAATPCGHIYCWGCIQGLCKRTQLPSAGFFVSAQPLEHLLLAKSKCPVCRAEFQAQSVRAIYC